MTENYRVGAVGTVTPPADMMAAAKASLTEEGFAELMRETGGASPTPAQLVRIADREREAQLAAGCTEAAAVDPQAWADLGVGNAQDAD